MGIRDILQAAGDTQPTLYHHFAYKASFFPPFSAS
jgi:AcrR family transcriptional regulator